MSYPSLFDTFILLLAENTNSHLFDILYDLFTHIHDSKPMKYTFMIGIERLKEKPLVKTDCICVITQD